ncbi:MAG: hypothetical protein MPW15_21830 [Candidatus Manganitrophus sp.]|nr:hypothetical protein [Candidatus Manganitrophus sp.]
MNLSFQLLRTEVADVDEMAGDRRRRGHGRADQVGAAALPLAALEIAVGGRGAAFAGLEPIGVHRRGTSSSPARATRSPLR